MYEAEADRTVKDLNVANHDGRVERLGELSRLLPDEGLIGFSGQGAEWLFEDIKATWLYSCFVATILTAALFCEVQLAGLIRSLPDDPALPDEAGSLEELAAFAAERSVIDSDTHAQLLTLNDAAAAYRDVGLHEARLGLSRRLVEAELFGGDAESLLGDARVALRTSVALLYRR
jgi:hypothetical protein